MWSRNIEYRIIMFCKFKTFIMLLKTNYYRIYETKPYEMNDILKVLYYIAYWNKSRYNIWKIRANIHSRGELQTIQSIYYYPIAFGIFN